MITRAALLAVFGSTLAIGLVYIGVLLPGEPPAWTAWLMVLGVGTLMVGTAALGATRHNRLGKVGVPLTIAWAIVVVGFSLALALPADSAAAPRLIFGLPRGAALILYGVGLLPLFVMPLAYALTFDEVTLSEEELARLRAEAARINESAEQQTAEYAEALSR